VTVDIQQPKVTDLSSICVVHIINFVLFSDVWNCQRQLIQRVTEYVFIWTVGPQLSV